MHIWKAYETTHTHTAKDRAPLNKVDADDDGELWRSDGAEQVRPTRAHVLSCTKSIIIINEWTSEQINLVYVT